MQTPNTNGPDRRLGHRRHEARGVNPQIIEGVRPEPGLFRPHHDFALVSSEAGAPWFEWARQEVPVTFVHGRSGLGEHHDIGPEAEDVVESLGSSGRGRLLAFEIPGGDRECGVVRPRGRVGHRQIHEPRARRSVVEVQWVQCNLLTQKGSPHPSFRIPNPRLLCALGHPSSSTERWVGRFDWVSRRGRLGLPQFGSTTGSGAVVPVEIHVDVAGVDDDLVDQLHSAFEGVGPDRVDVDDHDRFANGCGVADVVDHL